MSQVFTILPMSQSVELKPGESYTGSITVTNSANATEDFHYLVTIEPYSALSEDYQIDHDTLLEASRIVDWITIAEPQGVLQPNEQREVEYTITVPEDAAGGGQYAALMVAADPASEQNEGLAIQNSFAIGSIIYADIDGEVTHAAKILTNDVAEFALVPPVVVNAVLENQGNVHETAVLELNVVNKLSGEQIFSSGQEKQGFVELVLPGATRAVSRQIDNLPVVGVVNVKQTVYYGNEISTMQKDVVICPIWFILLIVAVIVGVIGLIVGLLLHRKHSRARKLV